MFKLILSVPFLLLAEEEIKINYDSYIFNGLEVICPKTTKFNEKTKKCEFKDKNETKSNLEIQLSN